MYGAIPRCWAKPDFLLSPNDGQIKPWGNSLIFNWNLKGLVSGLIN